MMATGRGEERKRGAHQTQHAKQKDKPWALWGMTFLRTKVHRDMHNMAVKTKPAIISLNMLHEASWLTDLSGHRVMKLGTLPKPGHAKNKTAGFMTLNSNEHNIPVKR